MKPALLLIVSAAFAAAPVNRGALAVVERLFDSRIERLSIDDPFDLLGATRAVYLEGYGAVLTAEANLVTGPAITPFRPALTKEQVAKLRQKKQQRLPLLKTAMREMLLDAAASLDQVPLNEQVVVAVTLFYFSWEDKTGLPGQVLMHAPRQTLLNFRMRRITATALDGAIQVKEF